jgi:hypothetical protein
MGQPSVETDIQHVLFERGGVAADPDQQPLLGGLSNDGVKRAGSSYKLEERRGKLEQRRRKQSSLHACRWIASLRSQ